MFQWNLSLKSFLCWHLKCLRWKRGYLSFLYNSIWGKIYQPYQEILSDGNIILQICHSITGDRSMKPVIKEFSLLTFEMFEMEEGWSFLSHTIQFEGKFTIKKKVNIFAGFIVISDWGLGPLSPKGLTETRAWMNNHTHYCLCGMYLSMDRRLSLGMGK